jgi:folate-dependent phosphoribosylglycinamide formyltransferase PurN
LISYTPSQFRTVSSKRNPDLKAAMKADFERQVSEVAGSMCATLMLSDHFMLQIRDLLNDWRILNVHPAITNGANALKGKTPTKDAIDRANGRFVDPHTGQTAEPRFITGATFHIMDGGIDTGPAITDIENTHFTLSTSAPQLRSDNYRLGKLPVLGGGFDHYLNNVRQFHTTGLDPRSNLTLTT